MASCITSECGKDILIDELQFMLSINKTLLSFLFIYQKVQYYTFGSKKFSSFRFNKIGNGNLSPGNNLHGNFPYWQFSAWQFSHWEFSVHATNSGDTTFEEASVQAILNVIENHENPFSTPPKEKRLHNIDFPPFLSIILIFVALILISPLSKPIWQPPLQISSFSPKPSCQVSLPLTPSKSPAITFTLASALKVVSPLTVT